MTPSNSLKSVALISVTAAATTLLIQACGGGAAAQSANEIDPIVGVWESTATVKDCSSGAVLSTFKGHAVLHHGGTFSADSSRPPPSRGAAFGTWKHESGTTYALNLVLMRFNPDLTLAGTQKAKITRTLSADGNSFTSDIAGQVIDLAGTVVQQYCATDTGTRVTW
jgi:hypothetical protein